MKDTDDEKEEDETTEEEQPADTGREGFQEKRRKGTRVYKLLSFCETRWYSCWTVMVRFFTLIKALTVLMYRCEQSKYLLSSGGKEFVAAMKKVKRGELYAAIHYLKPLVQGIIFCQGDSTIHMDVEPLMNALERFYQEHSAPETDYFREYGKGVFPIPKERVEQIFSPRLELFRMKLSRLRQLFNDSLFNDPFEEVEEGDKRVQGFIRSLEPELSQFFTVGTPAQKQALVNRAKSQALLYLKERRMRIGTTAKEYMRENSSLFPELKRVYDDIFCCPASSAAVERAFSVQGCMMVPKRNGLKQETIRLMMMIRMNSVFVRRNGREADFVQYIMNHSLRPARR